MGERSQTRNQPPVTALEHCFQNKLMSRVWKCRPGEIAGFCASLRPGTITGS